MNVSEPSRKCLVVVAAVLGLGSSMTVAQSAPATAAGALANAPNSAPALELRFEVASVRQNLTSEPHWRMGFTASGVSATDVTLLYAIEEAYGLYDEQLWSGIPPWIKEKRFDIEAKYDADKYPQITLDQRRAMLQQLLAERFRLVVHRAQREFPLYALALAKGGPKFEETKPGDLQVSPTYGPMCQHLHSKTGATEMKGCSMAQLAQTLTARTRDALGRTIVDRTGLTGRYNFSLSQTSDSALSSNPLDSGAGPSIFTAVKEQLGLILRPEKGPLDTIVIDSVEMPTEN
jgi:uncharacterized protein (TIGR03435 family)